MKKIFTSLILMAFAIQMNGQSYSYLGTFNSLGVPNYLVTSDVIPVNLLNSIAASLPEYFPVPTYHPSYIATGTNSNIVMQSGGNVWVTFVDEGAGYRNVLGYYTYPTNNPPTSIPSKSNLKIVFPNVSKVNSGGGLVTGNKVFLGHFNAGTTISWFLISDGYRNDAVTEGNWRLFSNSNFNPESNPLLKYHNVLLYDTTYNKVILGFEDIRRDNGGCDNDFNDAIFYVSSTPDSAILTVGMNKTTNPTPEVTTGNNGGLESNGNLSQLISKRYYERQNTQTLETKTQQMNADDNIKNKNGNLQAYIPTLSSLGYTSFVSTPADLLGVTNAIDILSVDYYDSTDKREAVILMTETENKVYNHTKSICDRLKNASITKIEEKQIAGINFITYSMLQNEGELEYVTCFSLSNQNEIYTIHNQWLTGQYPQKNQFINFQVWAKMPHVNQYIVEQILTKIGETKTYNVDTTAKNTPEVYFKRGTINEQNIDFEIVNNSQNTAATIVFNYTVSEQDQRHALSYPISLLPNAISTISIPFDGLFDADISIEVNNVSVDEMYLADGAWGADFPPTSTSIDNFTIRANGIKKSEGVYPLQRSADLKATVSDYLTLYKMLRPSNLPVNLTEYEYLNFTYTSSNNMWLRLNKKSISSWAKQSKCQVLASDTTMSISIPLTFFKNELGVSIVTDDLLSLSYTISTNKSTLSNISVKNVSFSKEPQHRVYELSSNLVIYPNPATSKQSLSISFNAELSENGLIELISMDGKKVYSISIIASKGINNTNVQLPQNIATGVYILQLKMSNKIEKTTISIQ